MTDRSPKTPEARERQIAPLLEKGAAYRGAPFTKGDPRINRSGPKPRPPGQQEAAESAWAWLRHVSEGTHSEAARSAFRIALKEAARAGAAGLPEALLEKELETLAEQHFASIMLARVLDKQDVVRVKVCTDLVERHYGKPRIADESTPEGRGFVRRVERVIVDAQTKVSEADSVTPGPAWKK
jgi:hypothetical protein